jgi:ADP-sugar diphosphatase
MWGDRVGFLKLTADIKNSAGAPLGGAVFLRGPAVAMLVMLIPDDVDDAGTSEEEERYVVLTKQPRVPAGSLDFTELPAGMLDDADSTGGESTAKAFAGAAAREIKEELDMDIPASELTSLTDLASREIIKGQEGKDEEQESLPFAMYPSAGGCDEYIPILMHERRVPRSTLKEWQGRLTGLREEGEKITLKIVPMKDLWREGLRDAKALAAVALWEGLRREGKLPKGKPGKLS